MRIAIDRQNETVPESTSHARGAGHSVSLEPPGVTVQRTDAMGDGEDPERIRAAARPGTSGPGAGLPFLEKIQRAFGAHDLSGIVAHTERAAAEGARPPSPPLQAQTIQAQTAAEAPSAKPQIETSGTGERPDATAVFTESLQREWLATVLAEAAPGDTAQEEAFTWVYHNLIRKEGERGLDRSSAHRGRAVLYLIYLHQAGDTSVGNEAVPPTSPKDRSFSEYRGHKTVAEVCADPKSYFNLATVRARLGRVRGLIDRILKGNEPNPLEGCNNQGSLDDINNLNKPGLMWDEARYYFYLQEQKKVTEIHVHFYPSTSPAHSQFVFDLTKIEAHLKKSGVDLTKTSVPFVDVEAKQASFRKSKEELLYRKPRKAPPAK